MYDLLKLHFEKLLKMIIVKQNKKGIRMYPYEKRSYELRVWRKKIPKPGGKVARTFYMRVGYVFWIAFFGRNDFYDFWHP